MADGPYRFQQAGAGQFYYPQHTNQQSHHPRHIARNGSPVNSGRVVYSNDTPSPSRSPVSQATSHNPYNMYNQGHQQGQHVMMNGGHGQQRYMQMNMAQKFQHQPHQQHHTQQNHHHQPNHVGGHAGVGHQHSFSSGTMPHTTPHFAASMLHNGNTTTSQSGMNESISEYWRQQLQLVDESRQIAATPHHHCKKDGVTRLSKGIEQTSVEESPGDGDEERNRVLNYRETRRQDWDAMDLSGQGLRALSITLFSDYLFLGKLFIDGNRLRQLNPAIGQLRNLTHLDASHNELMAIPEEIGMLVNLKSLLLFDNQINSLPYEIGHLHKLDVLGVEGNPLDEEMKEELYQNGTKALVTHLRENTSSGPPPNERDWHVLDDSPAAETLSVLSYNILCDKYATSSQYGYSSSEVLSWDYRKDLIIREVKEHNADIVCMQEVDQESYNEFFRRELAYHDYRGVFWPKSRAKTMAEREAKLVDGCATFFKVNKYVLLDKQLIDFANTAINRPDMKGEHDTFNRVMPRDNIAVATFFENRLTGSRLIVVNAHIFWDPAYKDVKLVQVAILMEQISGLAEKWAKHPACTDKAAFRHSEMDEEMKSTETEELQAEPNPSLEYSSGSQIPLILCGDFNSGAGSGVYDLITQGSVSGDHSDLANRGYGNFTRDGIRHPFSLKSAYSGTDELSFTNYTPNFTGVLDYIWFSTNALQIRGVLGDVDHEYLRKVPGFPNHHFPSDHLALRAEFSVKSRKDRKVAEGPSRERRN